MACKIMFIKNRLSDRSGHTLVEFMIALAISSLVTTAVGGFFLYSGKSFAGMSNYVDLEKNSQGALDTLTRDIRQASALTAFTTNNLALTDGDGTALVFSYSPSARTLTRTKGGASTVLLTECDFLTFSIFQRNPIGGTYDEYPTAQVKTCKLINVNWICSRKILGTRLNTESVQTAKVVLRKETSITIK